MNARDSYGEREAPLLHGIRSRPGRARVGGEPAGVVEGAGHHLLRAEPCDVGYWMPLDLDANRVDQDRAADPRAVQQGQFGRDPAAHRVPDYGDVPHVQPVQQGGVETGQVGDAGQSSGPGGAVETGVSRHDHPGMLACRQQVTEPGHRGQPAAPVKQEDGLNAVPFVHHDVHLVGAGYLKAVGGRGRSPAASGRCRHHRAVSRDLGPAVPGAGWSLAAGRRGRRASAGMDGICCAPSVG